MADIRRDIGQAGPILNQGVSGTQAGQGNIAAGASMLGNLANSIASQAPAPRAGLSESKLFDIAKEKEETRRLGEAFMDSAATLGIEDPTVLDGVQQLASLQDAKEQGTMKRSLAELRQSALAKQIMSKYAGDPTQIGHTIKAMEKLGIQPLKSIIEERERLEQDAVARAEKERERAITYATTNKLAVYNPNGGLDEELTMARVAQYSAQVSADAFEAQKLNMEAKRLANTSARLELDSKVEQRREQATDKTFAHVYRGSLATTMDSFQQIMDDPNTDVVTKKQAIADLGERQIAAAMAETTNMAETYGVPSNTLVDNYQTNIRKAVENQIKILDNQMSAPEKRLEVKKFEMLQDLSREYPELYAMGVLSSTLPPEAQKTFATGMGLSRSDSPFIKDAMEFVTRQNVTPRGLKAAQNATDAGNDENNPDEPSLNASFNKADQEVGTLLQIPINTAETAANLAHSLDNYMSLSRHMDPKDKGFVIDKLMMAAPKLAEARQVALREGDMATVIMIDQGLQDRITVHLDDMFAEDKGSFGFTPNQTKVGVVFDEEMGQFREAPMGDPRQFLITDLRAAFAPPSGELPMFPVQYTGPDTVGGRLEQTFGGGQAEFAARGMGDKFGGEVMEADRFSKALNTQYAKLLKMFQDGGFDNPEGRALTALGVEDTGRSATIPTAGALRAGGLDPMQSEDLEVVKIGSNVYLRPKKGTEQSAGRMVGQVVENLSDAAFGAMGFDTKYLSQGAQRRAENK